MLCLLKEREYIALITAVEPHVLKIVVVGPVECSVFWFLLCESQVKASASVSFYPRATSVKSKTGVSTETGYSDGWLVIE